MSLFLIAIAIHTLAPPQVREMPNNIIKIAPSVKINFLIVYKVNN